MMKTRAEIKEAAKQGFRSNYWVCVGVMVLFGLIVGASGATGVLAILLVGPLTCGLNSFSVKVQRDEPVDAGTMFADGFFQFWRKVGGYWYQMLFTFLWTLLFVIPGIVKSYAYSQQLYILADCPDVTATASLELSKRMMNGHKWELFVLELSFLGWELLSILTFGILEVFYVVPYFQQAKAEYYLQLKEECLRTGVVSAQELYPL